MTSLDLNQYHEVARSVLPVIVLPASSFPDSAGKYLCDNCGRDITKHLHRGHAHVWCPMGPQRYTCRCGQRWLTGAVEWDHLGDWERHRRVRDTLGLSLVFAILAFLPANLTYFVLHQWQYARFAALVVNLLPIILSASFRITVAASIWRTRFRA